MVFLPEAFDYIEQDKTKSFELAESLDGPTISNYKSLAKALGVWLSLGGFHEKVMLRLKNLNLILIFIKLEVGRMPTCYIIMYENIVVN